MTKPTGNPRGRPPIIHGDVIVSARITADKLKAIDRLAELQGKSRSDVVRNVIHRGLASELKRWHAQLTWGGDEAPKLRTKRGSATKARRRT